MAYCRRCGTQLADGASFCHVCGALIGTAAPGTTPARRIFPTYAISIAAMVLVGVIAVSAIIFTGLPVLLGEVTGSGHLVTTQEDFSGFTSVSVSNGFRFTIVQSPTYSVNVTIDDNLVKYIQVTQSGNTLYVGLAPGRFVLTTPQVSISMPDLTRLDISGGSTGSTGNFVSTHAFAVMASGGSTLSATGNASSLTANASGGSRIDLSSLHVTGAKVDLSGGSWAKVNLDGRLDASVSGGSQLYYIGSPTLGSISTSGGSIVAKQ